MENVNFSAYDQATLRSAIQDYVRTNYPDEFQDWINSDEFIIKTDIISWLAQSISYRVDLNSRENFLSLAERRESVLRLARNVSYNVKRVTPASGEVRIESITTNQQILDQDGAVIQGPIVWNDPTDPTWLDKWNAVMNAAFSNRTQFGRPLRKYSQNGEEISLYRFNSLAPATGVYPFTASVTGGSSQFEIVNVSLDPQTGSYNELAPDPLNAFHVLYRNDGLGTTSDKTGFFLPIKQGKRGYQDDILENALSIRLIDIDVDNINNDDIWVMEVNEDGDLVNEWEKVDTSLNENVAYNTSTSTSIYEVITRLNDRITLRFGDGKYGKIPVGRFRTWFRTSDPEPKPVKASDIRNNSLAIPYSDSQGNIFTLLLTFSLKETISNGAVSQTSSDISTRANTTYYTQNRMVNNEDHNSLPLSNNNVLKVKAVNRTYSGHGLSVRQNDPTGVYQSTSSSGNDGRLYFKFVKNQTTVSANPSVVSIETIVSDYVQDILSKNDKTSLYETLYPEIVFTSPPTWEEDSVVNNRSRGRYRKATNTGTPYDAILSDGAGENELKYIREGSLIRFGDHEGFVSRVIKITSNGLVENGVHMYNQISSGSQAVSAFPAFRSIIDLAEENDIVNRLSLKRSFGIRWDQTTLSWKTILAEDLNTTSDFSLKNTGDTTKAGKDASWLVRFEYKQVSSSDDTWVITDRGVEICFESDRQVSFFHANDIPINDPETGKRLRDRIVVTGDNEHRDSFLRRGLSVGFGNDQRTGELSFTGDGEVTRLDLTASDLDTKSVFLSIDGNYAANGTWSLRRGEGNDYIILNTPLAENSTAIVRMDPSINKLTTTLQTAEGDDVVKSFNLGRSPLYPENIMLFEDGNALAPSYDYSIIKTAGNGTSDTLLTTNPPGNGNDVYIHAWGGSGPAFSHIRYIGDNSEDSFATYVPSGNLIMVFVNGQFQHSGYTLNTSDSNNVRVVFDTPPANEAKIDIRSSIDKTLIRTKVQSGTMTTGQDTITLDDEVKTGLAADTMFFMNGSYGDFNVEDGIVYLDASAAGGEEYHVISIIFLASYTTARHIVENATYQAKPRPMGGDTSFYVTSQLAHPDGYPNYRGIVVNSADANLDVDADRPFAFREMVIKDGKTDLVVWRKVERNGGTEWEALNENTLPRGTYENTKHSYSSGDTLEEGVVNGSIHYKDGVWLIANTTSGEWETAGNQTLYRKEIGRGGLKFNWKHFASDARRIDPSPTNINEFFVLTSAYYTSILNWLETGGNPPSSPTPEALSQTLSDVASKKIMTDAIIWRPAKFRVLFGNLSQDELRAKFVVIKVPGATIPDSDLKLRILQTIDDFFAIENWDFGESFYYSELAAYIHQQLPSLVQSVVIVPRDSDSNFGRLFQVRALDDELFISSAGPDDIEIAPALTDSRLRIV
jgi:hypothetical protein